MLRAQGVPGFHSGSRLISIGDGFYYTVHNRSINRIQVRCSQWRVCPGRGSFSLRFDDFRATSGHNHRPDVFFGPERTLRHQILQATNEFLGRPSSWVHRKIMRESDVPIEAKARLPLSRLRSAVRRFKNIPDIPESLTELGEILATPAFDHLTSTVDGQDNIFKGSFGNEAEGTFCMIFFSDRIGNYMSGVHKVFSDGTFDCRFMHPPCRQIWNIVTTVQFHIIPLVRVIMQTRSAPAYNVVLNALKQLLPQFQPRVIMTDAEPAMQGAWAQAYPLAEISTCLWHYAVAVTRHFLFELGLGFLLNDDDVETILRCCSALPLLPTFLMRRGLIQLWEEAIASGVHQELRPLFQYIDNEWLLRREETLSVCGLVERTNNACESDNKMLTTEVGIKHPNVWHLKASFVRMEYHSWIDLHSIDDLYNPSRPRKASALANDRRIQYLTGRLFEGQVTVSYFLHAASRRMQGVFDNAIRQH